MQSLGNTTSEQLSVTDLVENEQTKVSYCKKCFSIPNDQLNRTFWPQISVSNPTCFSGGSTQMSVYTLSNSCQYCMGMQTNNNNNNRIQMHYSRFFTISSQRRELSPTCTLKWPRRNRAHITCNTSSADHVQVSCYMPLGTKGQLSY